MTHALVPGAGLPHLGHEGVNVGRGETPSSRFRRSTGDRERHGLVEPRGDQGATVIVIEHDLDMIANADHIIDMGPGGAAGGTVVATGSPDDVAGNPASVTGSYYLRTHLATVPVVRWPDAAVQRIEVRASGM
jgi:hypothetical protein